MAKDVAYFLAKGRSLSGIERFRSDYRMTGEAHSAFAQEFGCSRWTSEKFEDGCHLTGLEFPEDIEPDPKMWRRYVKARNPRVFCPNKTKPEGKALAERMKAIPPVPTEWQLINYVMPPQDRKNTLVWYMDHKAARSRCSMELIGSTWVIGVHHTDGEPPIVSPLDAKSIKDDDLMLMREETNAG